MMRKWMKIGTVLALIGLAWPSQHAHAQNESVDNVRQLTRGLLWAGYRNLGTQGGILGGGTATLSAAPLSYPGASMSMRIGATGSDYADYWGIKDGYNQRSQTLEAQNAGTGSGVWVLARVGDTYLTSYTGPFIPTEDIIPMYYDVASSLERDWGFPVAVPPHGLSPGALLANWFPGAAEQTQPPEVGVPYEILNHRFDQYMDGDKDDRAENIVISQWGTKSGIVVTRKAKAWAYQGFDDFIIEEFIFENNGVDILSDTYFALTNNFLINRGQFTLGGGGGGAPGGAGGRGGGGGGAPGGGVPGGGVPGGGAGGRGGFRGGFGGGGGRGAGRGATRPNDDVFKFTDAPNYDGPAEYVGLKLNYQFDGDSPTDRADDTGEPESRTSQDLLTQPGGLSPGQLLAYQYVGMAPLAYQDAGASHLFNLKDQGQFVNPVGDQPVSTRWWEVRNLRQLDMDAPSVDTHSDQEMHEAFTAQVEDNPRGVGAWINAQSYGPYTMAPGEQAKIVVAYVAGTGANSMPRKDLREYSVDIETFARTDIPLPQEERLRRLQNGEKALVNHLKAAQFAYNNGYDLPDYPPDLGFALGFNLEGQPELAWSDQIEQSPNPDFAGSEAQDIAGYRVFRSTWQEFGPWELIADISAGLGGQSWSYSGGNYTFLDLEAQPGFRYFYNVRAYAKPHTSWTNGISTLADLPEEVQKHFQVGLEGGYASPLQRSNLVTSPIVVPIPGATDLSRVKIVPNPFSLSTSGYNYSATLKIRFVNIPVKCKIRIYNFAGELVGEVNHDNPTSGEASWFQKERNLSSLRVATGIYFYVLESQTPETMGQMTRGTFYIIR